MADQDRKLVVRYALTSMGEEGFPGPPIFQENLSKKQLPLLTFWGSYTTFTRLLFMARSNIYKTAAKRLLCSHRIQCRTVLPISVRSDGRTIQIRQTRLCGIAELLLIFFRDVTPKPAELDYGHHYEHLK